MKMQLLVKSASTEFYENNATAEFYENNATAEFYENNATAEFYENNATAEFYDGIQLLEFDLIIVISKQQLCYQPLPSKPYFIMIQLATTDYTVIKF
ncbi:hypothetical protein F511_35908 [Dorcoceras hygrometricum]|uniref:Uncharacterized protein n=1 Tax=Dorcoceras hygrometricum TaxID=472368 RepID=A0A2Z7D005_9LAMI|nr:hypothetical protein F511_35908 [Dorcoceras hygrometricum]